MTGRDVWQEQAAAFGEYLRAQRRLAEMSLRQLSEHTKVSNAYLSQLERGLHQPSVRVLTALAEALGIPPERLLAQAGVSLGDAAGERSDGVEAAIVADERLTDAQKQALLGVYRSFVGN